MMMPKDELDLGMAFLLLAGVVLIGVVFFFVALPLVDFIQRLVVSR